MSATSNAVVNLTLRNIEVGSTTEVTRAAPTPADPARREMLTSRLYRLTFGGERPGVSATFVVDIGWDGRAGETECPVEDLESVGKMLVREFASSVAAS
jgi:hypothetical protein